jgi:hypothetical protein
MHALEVHLNFQQLIKATNSDAMAKRKAACRYGVVAAEIWGLLFMAPSTGHIGVIIITV